MSLWVYRSNKLTFHKVVFFRYSTVIILVFPICLFLHVIVWLSVLSFTLAIASLTFLNMVENHHLCLSGNPKTRVITRPAFGFILFHHFHLVCVTMTCFFVYRVILNCSLDVGQTLYYISPKSVTVLWKCRFFWVYQSRQSAETQTMLTLVWESKDCSMETMGVSVKLGDPGELENLTLTVLLLISSPHSGSWQYLADHHFLIPLSRSLSFDLLLEF